MGISCVDFTDLIDVENSSFPEDLPRSGFSCIGGAQYLKMDVKVCPIRFVFCSSDKNSTCRNTFLKRENFILFEDFFVF